MKTFKDLELELARIAFLKDIKEVEGSSLEEIEETVALIARGDSDLST